jgi:hypothetical protein
VCISGTTETTIASGCLAVVTWLAHSLPVAFIPHELLITTMRLDVIDHRRSDSLSTLLMLHTQWMTLEVGSTCTLPSCAIATLVR